MANDEPDPSTTQDAPKRQCRRVSTRPPAPMRTCRQRATTPEKACHTITEPIPDLPRPVNPFADHFRFLDSNLLLPRAGDTVRIKTSSNTSVIRRVRKNVITGMPEYELITTPIGRPGALITPVALLPGSGFSIERRETLKNLQIGSSCLINLGETYALPNILCRCIDRPDQKTQYKLHSMSEDEYVWYGRVIAIHQDGAVLETDHGLFFVNIIELRNSIKLSEDAAVRILQLRNLEEHYRVISAVCPGDEVLLFDDRHSAAEANVRGPSNQMKKGKTVYVVQALIYQALDLPGVRVVLRAPNGKLTIAMRFLVVPLVKVLPLDGRDKMYGGLPAHYVANPDLLTPPQPAGRQNPNKLTRGSIFVARNHRAYRVVDVLSEGNPSSPQAARRIGYLVTNVRRHSGVPGVICSNPLLPNTTWFELRYMSMDELNWRLDSPKRLGVKRPREEQEEQGSVPKEVKIVYDNITDLYSIVDGPLSHFKTLQEAESVIQINRFCAASCPVPPAGAPPTAAVRPTAAAPIPAPTPMSSSVASMYV